MNDAAARSVEITCSDEAAGMRLDLFLSEHDDLELTRSRIHKLMANEMVLLDGVVVGKSFRLKGGEVVLVKIPPPPVTHLQGEDIPLDVIFEDDDLLVINKPAGMVTHPAPGHPSGTLVNAIINHLGGKPEAGDVARPGIVHRLDKNTSGLLVVARNEKAYLGLQQDLQDHTVGRSYLGLACGHLPKASGRIDEPIGRSIRNRLVMAVGGSGAREAVTDYSLTKRYRTYDLLDISLHTGRTHQIRVHLAHLGHPIFGDPDYGGREKWHKGIFAPERPLARKLLEMMPRQALHAYRLSFTHPVNGTELSFEAPLPDDYRALLETLDQEGQ
jgi:23S rRNA pseudouridine1911/1915/1917 synthase